ncbi:hypothetical protein DERP_011936 [Dermatophagoides pteronyssinus]|uniref:Uncharacterized protein n=1 Tax=Dermatophagoides pteronyssinus TaxID=6956 RepID=A0ABQ8J2R5_DERPT|nr:hypothetical protein DERP_011936 [Dermatophagoides pteronyssinus]
MDVVVVVYHHFDFSSFFIDCVDGGGGGGAVLLVSIILSPLLFALVLSNTSNILLDFVSSDTSVNGRILINVRLSILPSVSPILYRVSVPTPSAGIFSGKYNTRDNNNNELEIPSARIPRERHACCNSDTVRLSIPSRAII